jgi:secreted PhoX family phosphatase
VLLLALFVACSSSPVAVATPTPAPAPKAEAPTGLSLSFDSVDVARTEADKRALRTASHFTLNGTRAPLTYHRLLHPGDDVGGTTFGVLRDIGGAELGGPRGSCTSADHTGLLQAHGQLFMTTHIECIPGAIYLTSLEQDAAGVLSATSTRAVLMAEVGGAYNPCAATATARNTLLSSEEYEPDARRLDAEGKLPGDPWGYNDLSVALGVPQTEVDPYDYGWMPEIEVTGADGSTEAVKHYTMGRFSHEQGVVMPDDRTVYLADDGTNVGFFLFVADKAGAFDAGTLYAMRWDQTSAEDGGTADIRWISLGHASQDELRPAIRERDVRFDELFTAADPDASGGCPAGMASTNTLTGHECLAVKPGMDLLASRLETRRYAALKGATTELRKGEGLAYDPGRNVVYYAISDVGRGMTDGDARSDAGGPNHVRLPSNPCGQVLAFALADAAEDTDGKAIDSAYVATRATAPVRGTPKTYDDPQLSRNRCDLDGIANPDNIAYLPHADLLVVAEDTSKHENQVLWAVHVETGAHMRLLSAPWGGELTGTGWYTDVNGHGYLTAVVQHPFDKRGVPEGQDVSGEDHRSIVGYFGPFPPLVP